MITSSELIQIVKSYDQNANEELIRKAYIFSMESHGSQKRESGVPYFYHPLEVAKILAELRFDTASVITGLLHDVLEDTIVSHAELEEIFGSEILFLVDGVTKLTKLDYTSARVRQAQNFSKFLLALSQDIRVLVVKLVDRLHNMRTISYIPVMEKRRKVSIETLEIYAPLAERIGLYMIKDEIEDIAFYNLHPNEHRAITDKLDEIKSKDHDFVTNTINTLSLLFNNYKLNARIDGREKKAYSIWKKMQKQNVSLEQINDIIAFRVIVETLEDCYKSLCIIHTNFRIMPGRFKDYISIPKLNNYRSLHTTVIGPKNQKIEIQIRTREMHKVADEGIAAHWSYKSGEVVGGKNEVTKSGWVKDLVAIVHNSKRTNDLVDNYKLEMTESEIFCFTPKGDLISLPRGAAAIDFAYEIHTTIGNSCIGVKINGKMVPLRTTLRNGDQVEVLTSQYQKPEASWITFATTGKAKSCIKKFIKKYEKTEFITLGMHLIKYVFASVDEDFNEALINYVKFLCTDLNDLYYKIGKGIISLEKIRQILSFDSINITIVRDAINVIDFKPGIATHFSECCHPIIGDTVLGSMVPNLGLFIHSTSCDNVKNIKNEIIKLKWNKDDDIDIAIIAKLKLLILNEQDSFAIITNAISSNGGSITNIKVEHRSVDFFELIVDVRVRNKDHLGELQAALRTCSNVRSVRRL